MVYLNIFLGLLSNLYTVMAYMAGIPYKLQVPSICILGEKSLGEAVKPLVRRLLAEPSDLQVYIKEVAFL